MLDKRNRTKSLSISYSTIALNSNLLSAMQSEYKSNDWVGFCSLHWVFAAVIHSYIIHIKNE